MDNITFEAMPQAISELIQKVDTLQSTTAALQKHCSEVYGKRIGDQLKETTEIVPFLNNSYRG